MLTQNQFLTLSDKTEVHVQIQKADCPVWLIATHGLGEHLGRHQYLIDLFAQDFNILLYDLRGHGKSSGRRAHVDIFTRYYQDLEEIILMLKDKESMERFVLFGHSMGGTIVCGYVQSQKCPSLSPEKIFLSSPALNVGGKMRALVEHLSPSFFARLSSLPFSLEIGGGVPLDKLSHDHRIGVDYKNDSLCCLHIHTKLIFELILAMKTIFSRPLGFKKPSECAYGTKDEVVDSGAIKDYFHTLEDSVRVKSFVGAYHEIHHETQEYRSDYFDYLKDSLTAVLGPGI